jgi:hypothetical protein
MPFSTLSCCKHILMDENRGTGARSNVTRWLRAASLKQGNEQGSYHSPRGTITARGHHLGAS